MASQHCDLVLKFDLFNVKARYRRARSFLGLGRVDEAHSDLLMALRFEPQNADVLSECSTVESMSTFKTNPTPLGTDLSKGKDAFDPSKIHLPSTDTPSTSYLHAHGPLHGLRPRCLGVLLP